MRIGPYDPQGWNCPKASQDSVIPTPDEIRRLMVAQVVSSVRWTDCFAGLGAAGLNNGFECGPGTVLSGLAKRIDPEASIKSIFDLAGAQEAAKLCS